MNELVFKGQNGQVLTNSLLVAEKFCKEHSKVMRDIENLSCSDEFRAANFGVSSYISQQNKELPMCIMTKDGFIFLVMGYTGKKAGLFKEEYIKAFNVMEKALKEQRRPLSQLEILVQSAQALLEQSMRIENVEKRLDAMEQEREENGKLLLAVSVSSEKVPEMPLRDKIRQLVNKYASATNTRQQDVWHKIYDQLYYLYHISIRNYKKIRRDESKLEIAERNHFLDKIYTIISNLIREYKAA
jgi:Rha family phage regulatory protein|nr:MAG TPA: regulatory protein [Caudoviricetes sp.]